MLSIHWTIKAETSLQMAILSSSPVCIMLSEKDVDTQVAALEGKLAAEATMRADAEHTLDQERRSFQMATISSGSGRAWICTPRSMPGRL